MRKGKGTFPDLRAEITRARLELSDLAAEMNARSREPDYPGRPIDMSVEALRSRFKLRAAWKMEDAVLICDVLGLPYGEIPRYFYNPPEKCFTRRVSVQTDQ
ncbi:MAG: hypothetical protein HFF11_02815 [Angelakisella sp.]|jgi:hypothetical protein|nr:hypothetical protein [Angelakisella sp.]